MGKPKLQVSGMLTCESDLCSKKFMPENKSKIDLLFKIGGEVRRLCLKCSKSEQYRLKAWLLKVGKPARTKVDAATKAVILLTDPKDYKGDVSKIADAVSGSILADRTAAAKTKEIRV